MDAVTGINCAQDVCGHDPPEWRRLMEAEGCTIQEGINNIIVPKRAREAVKANGDIYQRATCSSLDGFWVISKPTPDQRVWHWFKRLLRGRQR